MFNTTKELLRLNTVANKSFENVAKFKHFRNGSKKITKNIFKKN
jgi:hypothetical protein